MCLSESESAVEPQVADTSLAGEQRHLDDLAREHAFDVRKQTGSQSTPLPIWSDHKSADLTTRTAPVVHAHSGHETTGTVADAENGDAR